MSLFVINFLLIIYMFTNFYYSNNNLKGENMTYSISYTTHENLALEMCKIFKLKNLSPIFLLVSSPNAVKESEFMKFWCEKNCGQLIVYGKDSEINYGNLLSAVEKIKILHPKKCIVLVHVSAGRQDRQMRVTLSKDVFVKVSGVAVRVADVLVNAYSASATSQKLDLMQVRSAKVFDLCDFVVSAIVLCEKYFNKLIEV